jgi:methylmalonyl-CoA mutase N-terminal domain/subunit
MEILRIDPALERKQTDRLQGVRARRDGAEVERVLVHVRETAAREGDNLMPVLLDAARAHASEGEIVHALQDVWGTYRETPVF